MSDQCPICKSENTIELYPENVDLHKLTFTYEFSPQSQKTFRVVRCINCSHVFCSPLPKDIYKNYEDVIDEEYLRHRKTRMLTARSVFNLISQYKAKGVLLDIGCATGDFLETAKNLGYSAEGLELSHWSSKIVKGKGIKVYKELLSSLSRRYQSKYDIVTMWGVIEHLEDPLSEMRCINRLLKPGGILALWTGNVDGLMSRILGRRWWYWQGQHIQYFTHSSLNYLAKSSGFEHITTEIYPIAATYKQLQNSLNRYRFGKYVMPIIRPLFTLKPICFIKLPGEMLWLGRKSFEK